MRDDLRLLGLAECQRGHTGGNTVAQFSMDFTLSVSVSYSACDSFFINLQQHFHRFVFGSWEQLVNQMPENSRQTLSKRSTIRLHVEVCRSARLVVSPLSLYPPFFLYLLFLSPFSCFLCPLSFGLVLFALGSDVQ